MSTQLCLNEQLLSIRDCVQWPVNFEYIIIGIYPRLYKKPI